jgi:hypothetical protein
VLAPLSASGQTTGDPSTARIQLGPLALDPRIALRNVGIDTNIFNADGEPEKDFTASLVPGVDSWLRLGRARLSGKTSVEWTYFHKATNQRSLNLQQDGRLDVEMANLTPFVSGSFVRTRARPNQEIDQRVQQERVAAGAGVAVRTGARLSFEAAMRQETLDFGNTKHGSALLAAALNRKVQEGSLSMRYELTPLTSFVLTATTRYDRFDAAIVRDADSVSIVPGLQFKPLALISGSAGVGVRRFRTLDADAPDFTGLVASVDLQYIARDATKFAVRFGRDVEYSFEPLQPFYVATSRLLTITQALGYDWDAVGRLGYDTLAYRGFESFGLPGARTDRVSIVGAGFGRRFGDALRIGFDADYARRTSDVAARSYNGMRLGGSVTYGY